MLDPFANSVALIASGLITGGLAQLGLRFARAAQVAGDRANGSSAQLLTLVAAIGVVTTVVGVTTFVIPLFLVAVAAGFLVATASAPGGPGAGIPAGVIGSAAGAVMSALVVVAAAGGAQDVPAFVGETTTTPASTREPTAAPPATRSPQTAAPVARAFLRVTKSALSSGSGIVLLADTKETLCDASCVEATRVVDDGSTVRLHADRSRGSQFVAWTGAECKTEDCAVTVHGTLTVSVVFTLQTMSTDNGARICQPTGIVALPVVVPIYQVAAGERLAVKACFQNTGRVMWPKGSLDLVRCCPQNQNDLATTSWIIGSYPTLQNTTAVGDEATFAYELAVPKEARIGFYLFEYRLVDHTTGAVMLGAPAFTYYVNVAKVG